MSKCFITWVNNIVLMTALLFVSNAFAQDVEDSSLILLPSGPDCSVPFGAYSTKLNYEAEWDKRWPVSDISDIVVRFNDKEPRFVFWRGTSYIPCWATYDGAWFTNEFFERRGGAASGTTSMVEPMSDKQCRYSNVRIIENNEARVVVHWRYAPTDLEYSLAYIDQETNWGDWADEYYILYPDAVGIRKATLFTSALTDWIEYQESIVINQPGTFPEDNLNYDAVTLVNLQGESKTYTWTENGGPGLSNPPNQACLQIINLKSEYKPFTVINQDNVKAVSYGGHAPGSHFNFWDHWPVSLTKSDTRAAKANDRPSHTSLSQLKWNPYSEDENSKTWIMMHGMTNEGNDELVDLAKSWILPAELKLLTDNYEYKGYDSAQRAYVIVSPKGSQVISLEFDLLANQKSPVVNPAFLIKNWSTANIQLSIDNIPINHGDNFRYSLVTQLDGSDLIIWIKLKSMKPMRFSLLSMDSE